MNEQGIASLGRGGDDQIGHLTTGEQVLPIPVAEDPTVQRVIRDSFAKNNLDADQYIVGHANNSINPYTEYAEFGIFKKIGKAFRKVAQVVGTVVGLSLGGPMGAAIGSTVGGGVRRGKFDLGKAVGDFAGGFVVGNVAVGAGYQVPAKGATLGTKLGSLIPGTAGSGWTGVAPNLTGAAGEGIGGFFQTVGANIPGVAPYQTAAGAAGFVPAGAGLDPGSQWFGKLGGTTVATPTIGSAWKGLPFLSKAGIGIGGMAALNKVAGDRTLTGPQGQTVLDPGSERYLTQGLRPANIPTAGIPGPYQITPATAYQEKAGVGGLSSPEQELLEALEERRRRYRMEYPSFALGMEHGGKVQNHNYDKGGEVDSRGNSIDTIPAMLTEDEHVLTADAIEGLGNGDLAQGHRVAKQLNDQAELQQQLADSVLQRRYFMQYPKFNVGAA